jgi:hypothetical protein
VVFPETGGCGGLYRNTPLLFLFHEIGRCRTVVHLTDFMNLTGKFKDSLCSSRFARVDVSKNADVSISSDVFHVYSLVKFNNPQAIFFDCYSLRNQGFS